MTPSEIKSLGNNVWGYQSGLLSVAELELLSQLIRREYTSNIGCSHSTDEFRVLEVGHYNGLSTCLLTGALADESSVAAGHGAYRFWELLTVDSHESDQWVPATDTAQFERNRRDYFDDPRLTVKFERSQTLVAPLDFDCVFYDGDHGQEQARFTGEVMASPRCSLFVFDDRDFAIPAECCRVLVENGWVDESPPLVRGAGDKRDAETMTLAVWRRNV